jgi:hypothetical protein
MMIKNNNSFTTFKRALLALLTVKTEWFSKHTYLECLHFLESIERYQTTRGSLETIRWLKDLRLIVYKYVANEQLEISFVSLDRTTKLPRVFGPLGVGLAERNKGTIRLILTILLWSRLIKEWKSPDISTITEGPSFTPEIERSWIQMIPMLWKDLVGEIPKVPLWKSVHMTSKKGPNGFAMTNSKNELLAHSEVSLSHLSVVGGPALEFYLAEMKDLTYLFLKQEKDKEVVNLRKLSIVKDTEGKSRIIAIGDYWSQTALKPLHDLLMEILKGLKSDMTYGQSIAPFGHSDHNYWSFDLTAATDRIPVMVYYHLLSHLFGSNYADSWRYLMTYIPFSCSFIKGQKSVTYATGQPMGLYSSWALLAITHHLFVRYSALKCGISHFKDYRILGDDIVIRHDQVALEYKLLLQQLGVGISSQKSMVSKDTFEFAKRIFHKDEELTAFPITAFISAMTSSYVEMTTAVREAMKRGYDQTTLYGWVSVVTSIYTILYNRSISLRLARKVAMLFIATELVRGGDAVRTYSSLFPDAAISCVTDIGSLREEFAVSLIQLVSEKLKSTHEATVRTCNLILGTSVPSPEVKPYSDSGQLSKWMVSDPITWVLQNELIKFQRIVLAYRSKAQSFTGEGYLTLYNDLLLDLDLRVFDPSTLDPRRKSQAISNLQNSIMVKALAQTIIKPQICKTTPHKTSG